MVTGAMAAPGELEVVRAFVNTKSAEDGTDDVSSPRALADWLADRGLCRPGTRATRTQVERAIALREALRALLLANNGIRGRAGPALEVLNAVSAEAGLGIRFRSGGGVDLEPTGRDVPAALGRIVAAVAMAMTDGTWERMKACREGTCSWAYYDRSKNRSRTWCSMSVCGNRTKVKEFRRRQRG